MSVDKIGRAIALWRKERRYTQAKLADTCGFGRAQLSRYEGGKELPKLDTLKKILAVLAVTPEDFFRLLASLDVPPGQPLTVLVDSREAAAAFQHMHAALAELLRLLERAAGPALRLSSLIAEKAAGRGSAAAAASGLGEPGLHTRINAHAQPRIPNAPSTAPVHRGQR